MALIGSTVEEKLWNYGKSKGMTDCGVAGWMGNLFAESGLISINLQNTFNNRFNMTDQQYTDAVDNGTYTDFVNDKAGYGLCQWTYWSRKEGLLNFAKSRKVSIGDMEMQLDYNYKELSESYPGVLAVLRSATTVLEASNAMLIDYERPASQSKDASDEVRYKAQRDRASYGQKYYDKFAGKGGVIMGYTNSPLVDCVKMSPNHSGKRTHRIDRITPHCVVGQCSAERIGDCFPAGREASCNYGIGYDGRVCLIVDEANRSWCTSSNANDQRAITIECASDSTHPYAFKDACYKKLVTLCIDICQRNGIKKMLWIDNKDKALAYEPKDGEGIFTVHRWFANKSCPGDWMYSRMGQLCDEVNAGLSGGTYMPPADTSNAVNYLAKVTANDGLNCRTSPYVAPDNLIMTYPNGTILTITKEQNGWGFTGAGWVSLAYVEKIQNIVEGDDYMTREQILKELGDQYIRTYSELPEWAKADMRELLDNGTINGGTDYATDPDDINMFMSDIKAIIVAKRMIEKR